jgi:hypothetical protein
VAGGGVGLVVEALGVFLDLFDGFAVRRKVGVGFVEEEKVIVPLAEGLLGGLVAGGEVGSGFRGIDAGFGEVAGGLGDFTERVEILVVLGVEAADVFGEPILGYVDELCAAEVEVDGGGEDGFEVVEPEFDFLLLLLEAFGEFAFGFFSRGGKIVAETFGVGGVVVGVEKVGVDVGIAHGACCAAHFAERALEGFGFFLDAGDAGGEDEELEGGLDSAGSGAEMVDVFGRGFFEAVGDGCFEHQGLTEKDGHGLGHDFTFRYSCVSGPNDDTTPLEKLRATGVLNGGSVRCSQEVVMKLTSVKSMVMKGVTVAMVAGAVALAAPAKAQAQQFAVGVQFGSPSYGYYAPADYYARQRYEELCRQRAFAAQQAYAREQARAQHEAWERHEAFERHDHDRDRDYRRDWDRR